MPKAIKDKKIENIEEEKDILKHVSVNIPKELHDEVVKIAIEEGRETFTNQCKYFLKKAVENYRKKNK
jgi:hypothetical protein